MMRWLGHVVGVMASTLFSEHMKDYRESRARIYEASYRTNTHINQIILTTSVASLATMAALNKVVFEPHVVL
jgi:hypothetical protein